MKKKPVRATVIDGALAALRIAVLAARGDKRIFGRARHRAARVLRSDIGGVPIAELLADLRRALEAIREGEDADQALGITRQRGTSSKPNLFSHAMRVEAWRDEGKSRREIEHLAAEHGIHLSEDRLHKLPKAFAARIKRFRDLKAMAECGGPPPPGYVKLKDRKSGAIIAALRLTA